MTIKKQKNSNATFNFQELLFFVVKKRVEMSHDDKIAYKVSKCFNVLMDSIERLKYNLFVCSMFLMFHLNI